MAKITSNTLALRWPSRNAAIEAAVRDFLAGKRSDIPLHTILVAQGIAAPELEPKDMGKLAGFLTRLAPHMQAHATHDGETTIRYGKTQTRWRWWGQCIGGTSGN